MNGVRRFLAGGQSNTPPPQEDDRESQAVSPKNTTAALFLRKNTNKPPSQTQSPDGNSYGSDSRISNGSYSSSPMRKSTTSSMASGSAGPSSPRVPMPTVKRESVQLNTRDELLMSLLTSEAVVDSRSFEILSAEETEELKKEQQLLTSRLTALKKKLNLETKIRDAALSLQRANTSTPNKRISKQTDEQLESAGRRVDTAQKELWRVSERFSEVQRRLLEHRAGILGFSVRSLEKQVKKVTSDGEDEDESGFSTPNRSTQMSPTPSSVTSVSVSTNSKRFDGAHLFAGHVDALVPRMPKGPLSTADAAALEAKLKTAHEAMQATQKQHAELTRDLGMVRLEKEQVETTLGMDLRDAEETIQRLEMELPRLEGLERELEELRREKSKWGRERETLEGRLEVLEEQSGDKGQMEQLLARKDLELRDLREQMEQQNKNSQLELENGVNGLRMLAATHGIPVMSGGATLPGITESLSLHLNEVAAQLQTPGGGERDLSDAGRVAQVLQPVWAMLPSPEARAAKLAGGVNAAARRQPSLGGSGSPTSPKGTPSSLSDMDVRSLKTLYDTRMGAPPSPNLATFSVDAFATRVQALVADDKSLIERLLRFAQAHDLLKKNAERAQKLAQESNSALETYQKQVRGLEERNNGLSQKHTALQDEIHALQETVAKLTTEKRSLESQLASTNSTIRDLSEANSTLTTRTITLAEEVVAAPEKVRQELQAQLTEVKGQLEEAQGDLERMRRSEQTQTEALLEELNTLQNDNGNLRAQLRAAKK